VKLRSKAEECRASEDDQLQTAKKHRLLTFPLTISLRWEAVNVLVRYGYILKFDFKRSLLFWQLTSMDCSRAKAQNVLRVWTLRNVRS